ncbi:MAG: fused MFS/spermidine synthase [bacterium]
MIISPESIITQILSVQDVARLEAIESQDKVLFEQFSEFHNIQVVTNDCGKFLKFDDSYQSGKIDSPLYSGNLPYINYFFLSLLFNSEIKNILFLGMGASYVIKDFLQICKAVKNIDIVEIDPLIPHIAKEYFDFEEKKPVKVHIQDARVFVRNSKQKYDLIICDIFSSEGMPFRFMTAEFFEEIKNILSDKGVFCANVFSNVEINSPLNIFFKSLYKTCNSVFKNTNIFPTIYGNMQMYRQVLGLKDELTDLTNTILISQNNASKLYKTDIEDKVEELQRNVNLSALKDLKNYATDYCDYKISLDTIKILRDNFIEDKDFTLETMSKYLLINEDI